MDKFFKISERGSNVRTEIIAGLTTFFAMAYIVVTNPNQIVSFNHLAPDADPAFQQIWNAVYVASILAAIIGTLLMALYAKMPFAQACGMGLNSFFFVSFILPEIISGGDIIKGYHAGLVIILVSGFVFLLFSVTGLRVKVAKALPDCLKKAIPAGIGLFIAFLGFQDAGIVVNDSATCVGLVSLNLLGGATWGSIMPVLVTVGALIAIAVLSKRGVRGAILWSILGGAVVYYALGFTVPGFYENFLAGVSLNPLDAFRDFGDMAFGKVFTEGFDFSGYLAMEGHSVGGLVLAFATTALAFCVVDMFDTLGTLYGACRGGNMLIKNAKGEEEVPNMDRAMLADALATCVGAVCGTSTVTTFVESSSGIAVGGRTGLTSIVTSVLFFIALFLSPLAALVPACAYSAALIYIGTLMISCVRDIDWADPAVAVPSFLTLTVMPFTYNISYGIGFGLISYIFVRLFTGKAKEINAATWIISALFAAMFLLTH